MAEQAVAFSEKLLSDNKRQVEVGTLAPIEVVRAGNPRWLPTSRT